MAAPQKTPASHYFWCPAYLTDEMRAAGQHALERAREDGCAGLNSLAYAYAMAALDEANQDDPPQAAVPDGYQLVLSEPTPEMLEAGLIGYWGSPEAAWGYERADARECYRAMLEATPSAAMVLVAAPPESANLDWSHSTTGSVPWKNPLFPMKDRLLMADGAVAWQRKVIANLRDRLQSAPAPSDREPWGYAVDVEGYTRLLERTEQAAQTQAAHFRSRGREVTVTALVPDGGAMKQLPEDVDSRPEERGEPEPRYHPVLSAGEMAWLRCFFSACGASGRAPAALPHGAVIQLEHAGVLRRSGDGRHELTRFGEYVLNEEVGRGR